jgi:hypothetical protein
MHFAACHLGPLRAALERALVWASLACYLTTASGVPLPAPGTARAGETYPCQHGRCGCITASQCWSSCCCHTPRERLAWAQRHGVVPPIDLLALAEKTPRGPAVAQGVDCCTSTDNPREAAGGCHESKPASRTIVAIEALRCRGASTYWVGSGAVTLPRVVEHRVAYLPSSWLALADQGAPSRTVLPDEPPPRDC